jgi:DNA-binding response OmpR family regulator
MAPSGTGENVEAPVWADASRKHELDYGSVLVVDDDTAIRKLLTSTLSKRGFRVESVADGKRALEVLSATEFDLIILDVVLPGLDGLSVCTEVRRTSNTPIMMLSGLTESTDKVLGLEVGADDYMTKPFCLKEMVARVRAHIRRFHRLSPASLQNSLQEPDPVGETTPEDWQAWLRENRWELTLIESRILRCLLEAHSQPVAREEIMERVWDTASELDSRAVDSHIRNLRKKLGSYGRAVLTIRGIGYKLDQNL